MSNFIVGHHGLYSVHVMWHSIDNYAYAHSKSWRCYGPGSTQQDMFCHLSQRPPSVHIILWYILLYVHSKIGADMGTIGCPMSISNSMTQIWMGEHLLDVVWTLWWQVRKCPILSLLTTPSPISMCMMHHSTNNHAYTHSWRCMLQVLPNKICLVAAWSQSAVSTSYSTCYIMHMFVCAFQQRCTIDLMQIIMCFYKN